MSQNEGKPWERPWTTKQMIENASNWNLAGDAGLLRYLEDFSEKMLSRVKDTNDRLNNLVENVNEASLALSNVTNKFMGLRNTQFIESRVYEDDETLPTEAKPEQKQPIKQTDSERLEEMKQAILNGLDVIDECYEKVEIPESDSDEDTVDTSIIYRPIDPYVDRPLPYVIGTAEWHKYWHVGLAHSSSDSEIENEQYSESESEQEVQDLPVRNRSQIPGISDSDSEDMSKNKIPQPIANSTAISNLNRNMFDSSSESDAGSLPPQINTVNSNFAEELAAKLGKFESVAEAEINNKPIKPARNLSTGLFSDEPPPLEDDGIFASKNTKPDLFSGGLFDDLDGDSNFWNTKASFQRKTESVTSSRAKEDLFSEENEEDNDIFSTNIKKDETNVINKQSINYPKKTTGLFDEDDDDLFNTASLIQSKKSILPPYKTSVPLISDEPPELETTVSKSSTSVASQTKKPVGGVLLMGSNNSVNKDLQKILKNRTPSIDSESNKEHDTVTQRNTEIQKEEPKPVSDTNKITRLFDDTSPLFTDDIFSSNTTKKFTSSLFDTEPPALNDELFKPSSKKEVPKEAANTDQSKKFSNTKSDLFNSEPPPLTPGVKSQSIFDDGDDFEDSLFSTKSKIVPKPKEQAASYLSSTKKSTSGLFDDDTEDSLFSSNNIGKSHSLFDPNPPELVPSHSEKHKYQHPNLFDPNPPELDESDTKSESHSQLSMESESTNFGIMNSARASLFDSEPPLLANDNDATTKIQNARSKMEQCKEAIHKQEIENISEKKTFKMENSDSFTKSTLSEPDKHNRPSKLVIKPEDQQHDENIFSENKTLFTAAPNSKQNLRKPDISDMKKTSKVDIISSLKTEQKIKHDNAEIFSENKSLFRGDLNSPSKSNLRKEGILSDLESKRGNEDYDDDIFSENKNLFTTKSHKEKKLKPENKLDNNDIFAENKIVFTGSLDSLNKSRLEKSDIKTENEPLLSGNTNTKTSVSTNMLPADDQNEIVKAAETFKKVLGLFDDDEEDIFKESQTLDKNKNKSVSLFQHSDSDDDLFSNKSRTTKSATVTNVLKLPKSMESKNIIKDELFAGSNLNTSSEVDLFTHTSEYKNKDDELTKNNDAQKLIDQTKDVKENMENFKKSGNIARKFDYEENLKKGEIIKSDPSKRLNFEKSTQANTSKETGSSPGKLKHNLNINVAALLPGAGPPRRQNLEKSASLDSSESNQNIVPPEHIKHSDQNIESKLCLEKSVSFDYPVETNEILSSAAKERVRIPAKRRPSTRKARQEAIRKSGIDFGLENPVAENIAQKSDSQNILNIANNNINNGTNIIDSNIKCNENEENNKLKNSLSPSTDEENLFKPANYQDVIDTFEGNSLFNKPSTFSPALVALLTEDLPKTNTNIKKVESDEESDDDLDRNIKIRNDFRKKSRSENVFSQKMFSSSDSDDIFGTPNVESKKDTSKNVSDNNNVNLSSDDLFKPIVSTASSTKEQLNIQSPDFSSDKGALDFSKLPLKPATFTKKTLFAEVDDDDDDDIFGGSSKIQSPPVGPTLTTQIKDSRKPLIKKLEKLPVANIEDPLEASKQ